jgi:glycosyltransferase involved in cell wall biosynthesis
MPSLSIVVPAYLAEEYLAGCLDTILSARSDELEVIVVDDCSPDESRAIAERYAAEDDRVTVVSTPGNAGSGPARNHGLGHATGDHVWFVDADDRLKPGAIEHVLATLHGYADDDRPDVILVQHEKVRDTGLVEPGDLEALAERCPADPSGFTLEAWPGVVDYTHTPWTKIARREFLTGIDLEFPGGWYTDIPWTYGLFRRAKRMAVITEPCYQWCQRAGSSITRTRDDRHFDVFTQWQRTWEDYAGVSSVPVRTALFNHMVWHLLLVIGNTERIDPRSRRRFFRRSGELYRRYHPGPEAWSPADGVNGLKQRLLAARMYLGYEILRQGWRAARATGSAANRIIHARRQDASVQAAPVQHATAPAKEATPPAGQPPVREATPHS